jgi:hypothetical protein
MGYCNCRFCKKSSFDGDDMVKYGVRHYAHFKCYLDAGKTLDTLSAWQANNFPYFLLKDRGLLSHPKLRRTKVLIAHVHHKIKTELPT